MGTASGTTTNTTTTTTTTNTNTNTTTTTPIPTTPSSDQTGADTGPTNSGGMTISATGLHVVFTQPARPGVPAHNAEYVLGEVFLDSLAVPAAPLSDLDLYSSSLSSSCPGGGQSSGTESGGASLGGGGSSAGGATSSGSLSSDASAFGSTSQPTSGSTGSSLPAAFAEALRKPLWLLLAYVVWQALVIGTGVSLWNWRRGDAS
jgi:hypothetical protein